MVISIRWDAGPDITAHGLAISASSSTRYVPVGCSVSYQPSPHVIRHHQIPLAARSCGSRRRTLLRSGWRSPRNPPADRSAPGPGRAILHDRIVRHIRRHPDHDASRSEATINPGCSRINCTTALRRNGLSLHRRGPAAAHSCARAPTACGPAIRRCPGHDPLACASDVNAAQNRAQRSASRRRIMRPGS